MRVYIADDEPEVRQALRLLLEQKLGSQVVGEAAHTHGLISLLEGAQADFLILDWELPGRVDGMLIREIRALAQAPRILVVSCHPDLRGAALAAGADGFADKGDTTEALLDLLTA